MLNKEITVEVAYATPKQQSIISVNILEGSSVELAIKSSGILSSFPEINLHDNKIGIFGKFVTLNTTVRHLDRIEIYRSLLINPKEIRKLRAEVKDYE